MATAFNQAVGKVGFACGELAQCLPDDIGVLDGQFPRVQQGFQHHHHLAFGRLVAGLQHPHQLRKRHQTDKAWRGGGERFDELGRLG